MLVTALTLPEQISRSSTTCTGQNACSLETALISILSLFSSASWYLAYQDMLHLQKNVAKEKLITNYHLSAGSQHVTASLQTATFATFSLNIHSSGLAHVYLH